ncbi:MAG: alpha/beta fold hydrolase [Bacteroidales bacterium]|nr:alpha/beta fold hydrolase [Bacteroidales bacterium]
MSEKFTLHSVYDGLDISVLVTRPESVPVAVLQLAHGMRGHKERFLPFMEYLSSNGVVCVANDHRGHGESVFGPQDRGYMYSGGYVALVEDMKMVTDWAHKEYPGLPVFILGHSMGSLAVRTYLKTYDDSVAGVILCGSPSYNPITPVAIEMAYFLSLFKGGRMRPVMIQNLISRMYNRHFSSEGRDAWVCSDPAVRKAFADNPMSDFRFTSNALFALLNMMKETYSENGWCMKNPELPIYFVSGADDPCMRGETAFHDSAWHMAHLGYKDVTAAIYSEMRHEILNEIDKRDVWEDVLEHILLTKNTFPNFIP